jgi:hypothetical protein
MSRSEQNVVRVMFKLEPSEVHDWEVETLNAVSVGPDRYRLLQTPSYAYGYSHHDIVAARLDKSGTPWVRRLMKASGHSTYRIIIAECRTSKATFDEYWQELGNVGCVYEMVGDRYVKVDVPPGVDIDFTWELLEAGEAAGAWYFEEAHCGHTHHHG